MKFLRRFLDKQEKHFLEGGKLKKWHPLYDAIDTILYTPGTRTRSAAHVRDAIDLKRTMLTVLAALTPCILFMFYNTGYQANLAISSGAFAKTAIGWRESLTALLGLGYDPTNFLDNVVSGALYFLPIFLVVQMVGGFWEGLFAIVRKHEVNEGFLVTGMLIPLIVPPTLPLWQVAVATSFGVVVGKEIFGGTGMNIFNPALTARAFLFFAYPAEISGDFVWTAVDGFSGATPLSQIANASVESTPLAMADVLKFPAYAASVSDPWGALDPWMRNFIGLQQGSMGETSTIACLIGAAILIVSGVGSWQIMVSMLVGMVVMALAFNQLGAAGFSQNPMFFVAPHWHFVIGSFAFATVYMATDPVSAAMTRTGKFIYGFLIGILGVILRTVNPAYPEGWMLAILFMNAFSPVIDHYVVRANIERRKLRNA